MTLESTEQGRAGGGGGWAICCSGGGIRSAAYCLGALQSLTRAGLVAKARWILGVSGGSYIASSRALVANDLPVTRKASAYAPGTPEERNLRNDTHYIAPNMPTILAGVLSLLLGAAATFVIALAPLYAVAHAWGWLLRWRGALVPSGKHTMAVAVTGPGWWLPSVIAAGITLVLFGFWWWWTLAPDADHPGDAMASMKPGDHDRGDDRAWLVSWAARLAVALALAMLAVPALISWLTGSTGSLGSIAHFLGFGARPSWSLSGLAGLVAAVAAVARYCQAGLAKWTATTSAARGGSAAPQPGLPGKLAGQARQLLLPWLGSAAVVLAGVALALLWVSDGATAGYSPGQLLPVAVALAVTLLARVVVNVNRLSMHAFYRWRLASAFAVTRDAAQEQNPVQARRQFARAAATPLSALQTGRGVGEPDLVICGTVNITAEREVPPGQGGCCITFDPKHVTLRCGTSPASQALTSDYEALVGRGGMTLFDVSAISGAAVSPLMGSATRRAYRILFTAANVCLGVWLPHPNLVRDAHGLVGDRSGSWWERRPLLLMAWYLLPHPFWHHDATKQARREWREKRLWAHVLERRLAGKLSGALLYRVMQPTQGLLWAEAAGRLSYRGTWMYVTDGGHYDNLGLVEALRRGATNIVVLDASGDKADTWSTLGGVMAQARIDAGVEIDLDPTTMARGGRKLAPGQVVRPWAHGRFRRSQQANGLPLEGDIWVCKLGWWTGAPWDVLAYARQHPTFPGDSTAEQMYDASEFEAYQQLGAATVANAADNREPQFKPATSLSSLLSSLVSTDFS